LFRNVSDDSFATRGNMLAGQQKDLVKTINRIVRGSQEPSEPPMTSISAISSSNYQSPLQKLQDELQAEINSGTIGSSDQDALSSALTDIDSSLQSSRASDSAGGTRPSPGDLKSKIDDLIAGEVSSGKLTSDQATELQGVFKAAFANGPGGPGGAHGGHSGPPPADGASSSDSATDSASTSSGASSADDILQQFLQSLQESLSASSSTSYSATGSSSTASDASSSFSALLIDYQT
jgi:flagellar hook-basal body complex protein FliE